jgi:hypothetical protein
VADEWPFLTLRSLARWCAELDVGGGLLPGLAKVSGGYRWDGFGKDNVSKGPISGKTWATRGALGVGMM